MALKGLIKIHSYQKGGVVYINVLVYQCIYTTISTVELYPQALLLKRITSTIMRTMGK